MAKRIVETAYDVVYYRTNTSDSAVFAVKRCGWQQRVLEEKYYVLLQLLQVALFCFIFYYLYLTFVFVVDVDMISGKR